MRVTRVLNNNAVMVESSGEVRIVLGKAIGYGLKPGDLVDPDRVTETFAPDGSHPVDSLVAFLSEVPLRVVRVARAIVERAASDLETPVTQALILTMADHLHYALERLDQGIAFAYPLRWEVAQLYPRELSVGREGVRLVGDRLGRQLPDDEAVALAMHLVNARFARAGLDATVRMTEQIGQILRIVESSLGVQLDPDSMSVARFVTHLRYLFVRMHDRRLFADASSGLLAAIRKAHPAAYACAERIAVVLRLDETALTQDELLYLTLHVARLSQDMA